MVRKQLYLREDQDRALKERSRETGKTEAELVRQALDGFFSPRGGAPGSFDAFIHEAVEMANNHRLPDSWSFDRNGIHQRAR